MARAGRNPLFDRIDISEPQNSRPYRRRPLPRLLTFFADSAAGFQRADRNCVVVNTARTDFSAQMGSDDQLQARPYTDTAHTLTSTRSVFNAIERMRFSSISVTIPDDFLGQETQIAPAL